MFTHAHIESDGFNEYYKWIDAIDDTMPLNLV